MEIPDQLRCLFSAEIEQRENTYVIEIPEEELSLGTLEEGATYQIAALTSQAKSNPEEDGEPRQNLSGSPDQPPVAEGETRTVEIEGIGDQGDGITRVERGFVVIVPGTEKGEKVKISITDVRDTVAFADVVERISFYE